MADDELPEIETLLRAYAGAPLMMYEAVHGMSEAHAFAAPEPGEWSVAQVVAHLWTLDGHALVTFAAAPRPGESLMSPKPLPPFAALLDAFASRRAAVVVALRRLAPELWGGTFAFRSVERTPQQLVKRFVRHDATHLRQITATRRTVERSTSR